MVETINTAMGSDTKNDHLKVRYRVEDVEFEAEGPAVEVNQHTFNFFALLTERKKSKAIKTDQPQQLNLFHDDKPLLMDTGSSQEIVVNSNPPPKPIDLLSFFIDKTYHPETQKNEATQHDQLMIITEFCHTHEGKSIVLLEDYRKAYEILREIPVSLPANVTARLKELVGKKLLFTKADGYALTIQGKQHIEGIRNRE